MPGRTDVGAGYTQPNVTPNVMHHASKNTASSFWTCDMKLSLLGNRTEAACREGVSVQSHQVGRCCAAGYHQTAWLTDSESHSLMDVPESRSAVCKRNRRSSGRRGEWLLIFGVQDTHSKYGSTDELYVHIASEARYNIF